MGNPGCWIFPPFVWVWRACLIACALGSLPVNDESSEEKSERVESPGAEETDSRRGSKKIQIKETRQAQMILGYCLCQAIVN